LPDREAVVAVRPKRSEESACEHFTARQHRTFRRDAAVDCEDRELRARGRPGTGAAFEPVEQLIEPRMVGGIEVPDGDGALQIAQQIVDGNAHEASWASSSSQLQRP